jgi:uracil-DNA glycosylase family 4
MMREAGIDASRVRLANAIPFRPIERSPGGGVRNRPPTEKELRTYGRALLRDIETVQPKVIGALGRSAAMLFGITTPIERSRRRTFQFRNVPVASRIIRASCCGSEEEAPHFGGRQSGI